MFRANPLVLLVSFNQVSIVVSASYSLVTILSSIGTLKTSTIGLMPYRRLNSLVWLVLFNRTGFVSVAELAGNSGERYRAGDPPQVAAFTPLVEKAEESSGACHSG